MAEQDATPGLGHFDIVRRPIITEKSTQIGEHGQYVFEVAMSASKPEVRAAIESLFAVKVEAVNTVVAKGKRGRWRGRPYQRRDVKKAIVTLRDGQSIDVTTGI